MPDLIIKGMEMPESCTECQISQTGLFYRWCGIDIPGISNDVEGYTDSRPDWCPLRPAPDGLDRLTPQKPHRNTRYGMGDTYHDYLCPGCSRLLAFEPEAYRQTREKFCWRCGQAIDWSEVEHGST